MRILSCRVEEILLARTDGDNFVRPLGQVTRGLLTEGVA